jgi:hypothetical protein
MGLQCCKFAACSPTRFKTRPHPLAYQSAIGRAILKAKVFGWPYREAVASAVEIHSMPVLMVGAGVFFASSKQAPTRRSG